jgi:hypothetical protein
MTPCAGTDLPDPVGTPFLFRHLAPALSDAEEAWLWTRGTESRAIRNPPAREAAATVRYGRTRPY